MRWSHIWSIYRSHVWSIYRSHILTMSEALTHMVTQHGLRHSMWSMIVTDQSTLMTVPPEIMGAYMG